jgi:hypothetical protein
MEELEEKIRRLELELNVLKEKVNQLPETEINELESNKKRKLNKLDDISGKNKLNTNLPNRYKRWLPEEEFQLIEELKNQLAITEIANNHGRSNYAIECRIKKIVLEKSNTQSLESISNELKLDIVYLNKIVK